MSPTLIAVAPGVSAWIGAGGDSNSGAVETPDGLIVIDAQQYQRLARRLREEITSSTGKPIQCLVNTHCHLDHTAGNIVFADVPIMAHDLTVKMLHSMLGTPSSDGWTITDTAAKVRLLFGDNLFELVPENSPAFAWFLKRASLPEFDDLKLASPNQTFADHFAFRLPNDIMHLEYWGPAHCDGDLVIWLEKAKVAFLGDLLFIGRLPWLGDCHLDGWIDRLTRVLTLDIEVVIPGHGPQTDLSQVALFRDMLMALRKAVDQAIRSGLSEDAAANEVRLPEYSGLQRYEEWLSSNVRATYRFIRGR